MAKDLSKILVVDLEATCYEPEFPPGETQDIIEIGYCLLRTDTMERDPYGSLICKAERSKVSPFCTNLTSLTQKDVDKGMYFREAVNRLKKLYPLKQITWASWGDYDRDAFKKQCDDMDINYPFGKTHINAKNLFALAFCLERELGMGAALEYINAPLEGRWHRGGDDAWNTAFLLKRTLEHLIGK